MIVARWLGFLLLAILGAGLLGALLAAFAAIIAYPSLPSLETLTDYRPKIPLRVYTADGYLIGEFGEERRNVVRIETVPKLMVQAILAAEDERFYQHGGVDYVGVLRAAYSNFSSGAARQGASTITMQVARNFFLTKEKTLARKFSEALLALKIEHILSKDKILELYINQIYLGQRAYGFAAAAQTYFGKPLDQLNLGEMAMLAGLPKAPSRDNPIDNPKRAKQRQQYVLRRMLDLKLITDEQYRTAGAQPIVVKQEQQEFAVKGDYVAEMVRQAMYEQYQDEAYTRGFNVYTTVLKSHQDAAYAALRDGVMEYDRRHGYRGPEGYIELPRDPSQAENIIDDALSEVSESGDLIPAVVLEASPRLVKAYVKGGETVDISGEGLKFVKENIGERVKLRQRIRRGSLIRLQKDERDQWQITQLPAVEAALVSLNPKDGAILALVGGFDFNHNKFNHVTQAFRQPGSSFKPFIYSAALEKGFTPATVINDAPLVVDPSQTGDEDWEPRNFEDQYSGPIRFRIALAKSKNLVSVRILQAITPQYAQDYITRFGFDPSRHPPYLTMALGAGTATPLQMATGYAVFANGGYRITPYFIQRIEDDRGNVLVQAKPERAGDGAPRVIDARNAFIMTTLMQDVIAKGTGVRARELKRTDLAGKTGTTNENVDAWFAGYQPNIVAVAWIGYDQPNTLGEHETGAVAALPMWIEYMGQVLKGMPEASYSAPEGVVTAKINPDTGLRDPENKNGIVEYFYAENLPPEQENGFGGSPGNSGRPAEEIKNQLF
ncbi:MAG TPA: penicillin-binding protein 1A [Burkholderiales bacterium]|nr:penicillin-binding protein 1A [Burkholderiales bacterium]